MTVPMMNLNFKRMKTINSTINRSLFSTPKVDDQFEQLKINLDCIGIVYSIKVLQKQVSFLMNKDTDFSHASKKDWVLMKLANAKSRTLQVRNETKLNKSSSKNLR